MPDHRLLPSWFFSRAVFGVGHSPHVPQAFAEMKYFRTPSAAREKLPLIPTLPNNDRLKTARMQCSVTNLLLYSWGSSFTAVVALHENG